MDTTLLQEADLILSKCGTLVPPAGLPFVPIYRGFLLQAALPATPPQTQTFTKEVTGETTWIMRAIQFSISPATAVYIQVQLPNGKFLFNGLMDPTQVGGFGSWRYLMTRELECSPGTKLQLTIDSTTLTPGTVQSISVLFEGYYAYYMKNGSNGAPCARDYASQQPRYGGGVDQNIMAPCWMTGVGPYVPPGWDRFVYSSPVVTVATTGATLVGQCKIVLDQGDFKVRRILWDVQSSSPGVVSGTFLHRVRNACGYALMDDYLMGDLFVGSAEWPKGWDLKNGDTVFDDLQLVDVVGTGSMTVQMHLEGYRGPRVV